MSRSDLPRTRQRVFNESLVIIAKALRNSEAVLAGHEAQRLFRENPDCGLSEEDIRDHLVRLAVEEKLAVDTSR